MAGRLRAGRAGAPRLADLAAEGRLGVDGPAELRPFLIRLRRARVRVFGDVLEMTLSVLSGTMFRPGEVPERKEETMRGTTARLAGHRHGRGRAGVAGLAGGALAQDTTLRVAMGSPGEAGIAVWEDVGAQFEAAHPGVDVEFDFQDDDLYQTIGLPERALEPQPAGHLLRVDRQPDGPARRGGLCRRPHRGGDLGTAGRHRATTRCCRRRRSTARSCSSPTPPTSPTCSGTTCRSSRSTASRRRPHGRSCWRPVTPSNAAGITPIATGNKDLWAAGNWLAHLASRVVGEDAYAARCRRRGASRRRSGSRRSATSPSWASTVCQRQRQLHG